MSNIVCPLCSKIFLDDNVCYDNINPAFQGAKLHISCYDIFKRTIRNQNFGTLREVMQERRESRRERMRMFATIPRENEEREAMEREAEQNIDTSDLPPLEDSSLFPLSNEEREQS